MVYLSQPEITEAKATKRFVEWQHNGSKAYVVHMTCQGALKCVTETKSAENVLVETCPQYLLLDHSLYRKEDAIKWVMSPPLREAKDRKSLWEGIKNGVVNVVGTDHCPFLLKDKEKGIEDFTKIPNGAPGIEHRMELLYSEGVLKGRISLKRYVEVTSTNAARIFGLYPQKGDIKVGSDADIVIFNPSEKHTISVKTHHHHCDYSAYEGWEVTGKVNTVLLRGQVAIEDVSLKVKKGEGRFLKRTVSNFVRKNDRLS
ncbi:MAG: amidohydrolase family protein [Bacteroidales bacterium]